MTVYHQVKNCHPFFVPSMLCMLARLPLEVLATLRVAHPHFVRTLGALGDSHRVPELISDGII